MKAIITYSNHYNGVDRMVEINTIQELLDLKDRERHPLIIQSFDIFFIKKEEQDKYKDADFEIEVYNDYRE